MILNPVSVPRLTRRSLRSATVRRRRAGPQQRPRMRTAHQLRRSDRRPACAARRQDAELRRRRSHGTALGRHAGDVLRGRHGHRFPRRRPPAYELRRRHRGLGGARRPDGSARDLHPLLRRRRDPSPAGHFGATVTVRWRCQTGREERCEWTATSISSSHDRPCGPWEACCARMDTGTARLGDGRNKVTFLLEEGHARLRSMAAKDAPRPEGA